MSFGEKIKELRTKKGMTQKEFAKRIGKTETEVCRWLSGTHNLTLATISKISVALGVNIIKVNGYPNLSDFDYETLVVAEPDQSNL